MNFFDIWSRMDIMEGIRRWKQTEGAVLLDVRTAEEYASGHIPGSEHLPLDLISDAADRIGNRNTPVFVYCRSGARSVKAAEALKKMGYIHAVSIGGISGYRGPVERFE